MELMDSLTNPQWRWSFLRLLGVISIAFFFTFLVGFYLGDFGTAHESVMNSPIVKATAPIVQTGNWQAVVIIFLNNMLLVLLTLAGTYFIGWGVISYMPCIFQPAIAGYVSGSYARLGNSLQGLQIVATIGAVEFLVLAFAGSIGFILAREQNKDLALQTFAVCGAVLLIAAIVEVVVFVG